MIIKFCFLITSLLPVLDAQLQHYEGERVKFSFCGRLRDIQKCNIEIGRQYGIPFYRDGTFLQSSLIGDQQVRFRVEDEIRKIPIKYVVIHNVSRDDGGTYICRAYRIVGDEKEECSKEIVSLTVKYPPGKANCTILQDVSTDIRLSRQWQRIKCSAFDGNIPGILRCYQNGELALHAPRDQADESTLKLVQTMWIERGKPTKCCTQVVSARATDAGCNDFTLHIQPEESRDSGNVIFSSSTRLSTTEVYFHQFDPHSNEENVKTIETINSVAKFQLAWSGPLIVAVAVLSTIPLVMVICSAFLCFQRHRNGLSVKGNHNATAQHTEIPRHNDIEDKETGNNGAMGAQAMTT